MKKVIVIGGGASGLVASIYASINKCDVTILEKNNVLGKKILVTGNGKCNYFNSDFTINHFSSERIDLLNEIINTNNVNKVYDFFNKLGIVSKIKDGYYYPYSNQAISIQNSLITEVKNQNIKIITNTIALSVKYENNLYIVETNNGIYEADNIIISTGSRAFYDTEIENIGYKIIKNFNHNIIKILPALVQLKGNENYFKEWNGIRTDVKISLYNNNNLIKEEIGELQLTNYGISGICTLQLSNKAVRLLDNKYNPYVIINFLSFLNISTVEEFINYFKSRNEDLKNRNISELFDTILNYKLSNLLIKLSKIDINKKYDELTKNELISLANNMIFFRLNITGYNSFKEAQICSGGVDIGEINLSTMESKKQKGLYICGELLDIEGDCGGYNLGLAWITGILAGSSIKGE